MKGTAHVPRKRFGQHFLVDPAFIGRIVGALGAGAEDVVVEIGPGLGALTVPLLEHLRHLHVVEIDRDIVARLLSSHPRDRLTVHEADALRFDFAALGEGLRVIGNLPYNISTPLLFHVGASWRHLRDCHFMLQKEVVDRMVAEPGGGDYGRLSVMLQYRFAMEKLFEVPAGAFRPPPKVKSAVVHLVPLPQPPCVAIDEALFGEVVRQAFTQRRKTLRNALAPLIDEAGLREAGIDPAARPETLDVASFVRAANVVAATHRSAPPAPAR